MGSLLRFQRPAEAPADGDATESDAREAALVERARAGDLKAWSRLYHEHFDRLFRHVVYLTGDPGAAEDLVQETFARAFVGLQQFVGRGSVAGWLRGIAVNRVRKHWRSRYRGDRAMDRLEVLRANAPSGPDVDPEGAHLRRRRAEVLLAVLETLPEPLREAFILCDLHELPARDAAAALGVSPGNLRVRATRARAKIRDELVRLGWLFADAREKEGDRDDA